MAFQITLEDGSRSVAHGETDCTLESENVIRGASIEVVPSRKRHSEHHRDFTTDGIRSRTSALLTLFSKPATPPRDDRS